MRPDGIPGLMFGCRFAAGGAGALFTPADAASVAADDDVWLWLHLNLTDQRCKRWLSDVFGIPVEAAGFFASPPRRQAIVESSGFIVGHLADFQREFDCESAEFAWVHFLMGERLLITGRVKAIQSANRMQAEIAGGRLFPSPQDFLVRLVSNYPDSLDADLHRLIDELEAIEDHVLSDRIRGERRRLMLARREVAQLHRHMRSMRRALTLAAREIDRLPHGLELVAARLVALDQDFEALEARARFFHDEIDAKLASETNRQLYILSALTAAFLPPSLVAGLFGMNLKGIPWTDSNDGFWIAMGLAVLSSGLVILYLTQQSKQ